MQDDGAEIDLAAAAPHEFGAAPCAYLAARGSLRKRMSKRRARRRSTAVGIALAHAVLVSGCHGPESGFFSGPVAIRGDGESFEVAVCRTTTVITGIYLETRRTTFEEWVVAWSAEGGDHRLSRGEALTYDRLPLLFSDVTTREFPAVDPGGEVAVLIFTDNEEYTISAAFEVPERASEPLWLHPEGELTADPCG